MNLNESYHGLGCYNVNDLQLFSKLILKSRYTFKTLTFSQNRFRERIARSPRIGCPPSNKAIWQRDGVTWYFSVQLASAAPESFKLHRTPRFILEDLVAPHKVCNWTVLCDKLWKKVPNLNWTTQDVSCSFHKLIAKQKQSCAYERRCWDKYVPVFRHLLNIHKTLS